MSGSSGWNTRGNYFSLFSSNGYSAAVADASVTSLIVDSNLIVASKVGTSFRVYLRDSTGVFPIVNNIITTTNDVGIYIERANQSSISSMTLLVLMSVSQDPKQSSETTSTTVQLRDRDSAVSAVGKNLQS